VYEPAGHNRPNPLELSEQLLKGEIGTQSKTGKTALLVFFGKDLQNHTHFSVSALYTIAIILKQKWAHFKE
jgi:hypothetical protein